MTPRSNRMSSVSSLLISAVAWYGRHLRHPGRWRLVAFLVSRLGLSPSGVQLVSCGGFHWRLDPADHQQSGVFWLGEMDRWERFHLATHLKPGGVFLDVGANFGYYSVTLAKNTGVRAFAFEPQPRMASQLAEHVELNGLSEKISVQSLALADAPGSLSLTTFAGNTGKTTLSNEPGTIPIMRLDDWFQASGLNRVDAIKIDVEGVEARVLRGAAATLRQFRPVLLMEVNPAALARQSSTVAELAHELDLAGYTPHEIHRHRLQPVAALENAPTPLNIVCLPQNPPP